MNPDPETLFVLLQAPAPALIVAIDPAPAAPTRDSGSRPAQPKSIVGDHFFWASGSVLVDLS
jgi:hypothetical protein